MTTKIKIGIIGGSGLDNPDILKNIQNKTVKTPFGNPSDDLVLGEIEGTPCVLLARHGRQHNVMPGNVNYRANIWALKEEGCTHVIASTATGSLHENIHPGDLVVLDNFIDRTQGRKQTFYDGEEGHPKGVCHLQMWPAFNERTRQVIIETASQLNIPLHPTGTVVSIEGPRFSSKAESKMFQQWGGQVVLAKEAGLCYASIALATDYDCWRDSGESVSATFVLNMFQRNVTKITNLITGVVPRIAQQNWNETIQELKNTVKNSVV